MIRRLMMLASVGVAVAGVVAMAWGATHSREALALTNCDTSTAELDASELEVIALFNQARAQNGLAPYKVSPNLSRAAAWKSADPSATGSGGYEFSHTDSLGRLHIQRARDCGYSGSNVGENIAWGFGSAQSVVSAWLNSPGHRAAILGNYQVVGVGRVGTAWSAMFGTVDDSVAAAVVVPATPTPFPPTSTPAPTAIPTPPPMLPRASIPMVAAE
jgi:uncharacterized protein YkwD